MIFGILMVLAVGISWTAYGYIAGQAPKQKVDMGILLFAFPFLELLFSLISGLLDGFPNASGRGWAIVGISQFVCGIVNFLQLYYMAKAMQKGPNGIIWTVLQSGFIFPFFMGILFFGVPLTWARGIGLASVIFSLILFGAGKTEEEGKVYGNWKLLTFLLFLITGASQATNNIPSYYPEADAISGSWKNVFYSGGMMAAALVCKLQDPKILFSSLAENVRRPAFWVYTLFLPLMSFSVNAFLLYPGMDRLSRCHAGAIAFPLMVGSCLISFDLFSLLVLREKHRPVQWVGLFFCLLGVVVISL